MGRIRFAGIAALVVVGSIVGVSAPNVAGAVPPPGVGVTSFEAGSFVVSLPTASAGLGETAPLRLLTASARLLVHSDVTGRPAGVVSGVLVTFTSGGLPVCSAVTGSIFGPRGEDGVARCKVNPLTPGGLRAILTLSIQANYAGGPTTQPATGKLAPIGSDVRPPCNEFCNIP